MDGVQGEATPFMLWLDGAEPEDGKAADEGDGKVEGEAACEGLVGDEPSAEAPPFRHAKGRS